MVAEIERVVGRMQILHFGLWAGSGDGAVWMSHYRFDTRHGVRGEFLIFDFVLPDSDDLPAEILKILVI